MAPNYLKFAYHAIINKWEDDFEILDEKFIANSYFYDFDSYNDYLNLKDILPEAEGLYDVWMTGEIVFTKWDSQDGVEYDEEVYPKFTEVKVASNQIRELFELEPVAEELFTFK